MRTFSQEEYNKIQSISSFKHPNFQLQEIFKESDKVGAKKFLTDPQFDSLRDLLIACMFVYGIRLFEKREWYLQRGANPPDFEIVAVTDRPIKEQPVDYAQVEIVQIPPSFNDLEQAFEMIQKKKLSNTYQIEKGSILLIFINHHKGPQWSEELKTKFSQYSGNFNQIWAIYLVRVNLTESFVYVIKSIKPSGEELTLVLKEEFKKGLQYKHPLIGKLGAKVI